MLARMCAWNLFYSYSHSDALLRDELAKFLAPLKHQGRIVEWYDRKIEPGLRWESAISDNLQSADLVLLLVSADFLASDYCFGVEVELALERNSSGSARVIPILLKPCLWEESRFRELQILPRDARPVTSWPSPEDAFLTIANEINVITKEAPRASRGQATQREDTTADLTLVRGQIIAYARLYERIRQQMKASHARTEKMEEVFQRMKALAGAVAAVLPELVLSQSPGERLAAVSVLECFSSPKYFSFLVELIRYEKPFVGYHAARALEFAVSAIEPRYYPQLAHSISDAINALETAHPGLDLDRKTVLTRAETNLKEAIGAVTLPAQPA